MIPSTKVVAQILEVVTHWTLIKLTGINHENIFWTWEFPGSTPYISNNVSSGSVFELNLNSSMLQIFWLNDSLEECFFSFQEQVDDLLLHSPPSQNGCQGCWQKHRCDSPRSNMSQRIYNNNSRSDQKMPRTRAGEPDQERLRNGGYSYGKSCPFSVATEQKRSQGDRRCSEELYKATQRSGKLNLDYNIKGFWCICITQEKLICSHFMVKYRRSCSWQQTCL